MIENAITFKSLLKAYIKRKIKKGINVLLKSKSPLNVLKIGINIIIGPMKGGKETLYKKKQKKEVENVKIK